MIRVKRIIYKIKLKLLYITNSCLCLLQIGKKRVYIISSLKYKNKVKEDLYLQRQFLHNKYFAKIVAWEEEDYGDVNLIRSVWGYHHHIDKFNKWLDDRQAINDERKIKDNMNKQKQYTLLQHHHISTIDTSFFDDVSKLKGIKNKIVIKPIISESGDNTYVIEKKSDIKKIKDMKNFMVQPYIRGIEQGELSIIVIANELKYGIIRYPGIFTKYKKEEYIAKEELTSEVIEIVTQVCNIGEYKNTPIMRIDLVKDKTIYKVLEIELVDPQLFIETIPNKKVRKDIYQSIVETVSKSINH